MKDSKSYLVPVSPQGEKSRAGGPGGLPLFTRIEASLLEEQVGEGRLLLLPGQTPQTARPGNLALEPGHPALSTNRQPRMSLHWFSACLSDPCPRQCGTASMEGAKPTKSESKEHSLWPLRRVLSSVRPLLISAFLEGWSTLQRERESRDGQGPVAVSLWYNCEGLHFGEEAEKS